MSDYAEMIAEARHRMEEPQRSLGNAETMIQRLADALATATAENGVLIERVLCAESERPTWWKSCDCAGVQDEHGRETTTWPCERHAPAMAISKCGACGDRHIADEARAKLAEDLRTAGHPREAVS